MCLLKYSWLAWSIVCDAVKNQCFCILRTMHWVWCCPSQHYMEMRTHLHLRVSSSRLLCIVSRKAIPGVLRKRMRVFVVQFKMRHDQEHIQIEQPPPSKDAIIPTVDQPNHSSKSRHVRTTSFTTFSFPFAFAVAVALIQIIGITACIVSGALFL